MKAITAYHRLLKMVAEEQRLAMETGRYERSLWTLKTIGQSYENRNKSIAFRCIAYQYHIRNVSALTEALQMLLKAAILAGDYIIDPAPRKGKQ